MKETKKAISKPFYQDDLNQIRLKSNPNKSWQSVLHLDNKLFWTHETNLLEKAEATITKISQVILTE